MRSTTILLFVVFCAPMFAQTTSASIAGNIRDAQDAAISTANVTITEQSKNVSTVTKADESGRFVFPQLALS